MKVRRSMASALNRLIEIFFASIFVLATQSGFCQQSIRATIVDEESNPVAYASIIIRDDSTEMLLGTISDLNGKFTLNLPQHYENDTLKISSVGFETLRVPLKEIRQQKIGVFQLHQSTTMLPAIVFKGLTAGQLIEACVKDIPINYRNVSFNNSAYYWRAVKEDSTYKSLDEGTVDVREDHGSVSKRSFAYGSTTQRGNAPDPFIPFDNVENLFFFDFVRTGSGVTNVENLDEWRFEYLSIDAEQSRYSTVVKATRHDKLGHFIIYVNPIDYAFERVEFSYRWPSTRHPLQNSRLYRLDYLEGVVQYQKTDKKYGIKYLFCSFAYSVYEQYTFKKLLSRSTDFEFTLLSSLELQYGSAREQRVTDQPYTPVIVNKSRYCDALTAFESKSVLCDKKIKTPTSKKV